ncbi:hypothetical protein RUM44_011253 [Polyplax serrata]|uniref:Uncharacterized protein n=1 Tax=Polyplax serrata TaxID=468196 RepID=A0ABR1AR10_POLSC
MPGLEVDKGAEEFSKRRFFVATVTHKDLLKRIEDSQPETGEITSKVILAKPFPRDDDDDDDDDKRRKRNEFLSLSRQEEEKEEFTYFVDFNQALKRQKRKNTTPTAERNALKKLQATTIVGKLSPGVQQ